MSNLQHSLPTDLTIISCLSLACVPCSGLTGPDLQSMDVITAKELKLLENVLEVEVPKLRRMVGPSMGSMSDSTTKFISG